MAFVVKDSREYIAELEAKIAAAPNEAERAKTQERLATIRGQLQWARDIDEELAPIRGLPEFRALFE